MSYLLMFFINLIPGCKFRVDEEGEIIGVDEVEVRFLSFRVAPASAAKFTLSPLSLAQLGEWAYDYSKSLQPSLQRWWQGLELTSLSPSHFCSPTPPRS